MHDDLWPCVTKKKKEKERKKKRWDYKEIAKIEVLGEEEVDRENGLGEFEEQEICRRWITL